MNGRDLVTVGASCPLELVGVTEVVQSRSLVTAPPAWVGVWHSRGSAGARPERGRCFRGRGSSRHWPAWPASDTGFRVRWPGDNPVRHRNADDRDCDNQGGTAFCSAGSCTSRLGGARLGKRHAARASKPQLFTAPGPRAKAKKEEEFRNEVRRRRSSKKTAFSNRQPSYIFRPAPTCR